jgi:hypothetical protein
MFLTDEVCVKWVNINISLPEQVVGLSVDRVICGDAKGFKYAVDNATELIIHMV